MKNTLLHDIDHPFIFVFRPASPSLPHKYPRHNAGAVSPDLQCLQDARICTLARKKHKLHAGVNEENLVERVNG